MSRTHSANWSNVEVYYTIDDDGVHVSCTDCGQDEIMGASPTVDELATWAIRHPAGPRAGGDVSRETLPKPAVGLIQPPPKNVVELRKLLTAGAFHYAESNGERAEVMRFGSVVVEEFGVVPLRALATTLGMLAVTFYGDPL